MISFGVTTVNPVRLHTRIPELAKGHRQIVQDHVEIPVHSSTAHPGSRRSQETVGLCQHLAVDGFEGLSGLEAQAHRKHLGEEAGCPAMPRRWTIVDRCSYRQVLGSRDTV